MTRNSTLGISPEGNENLRSHEIFMYKYSQQRYNSQKVGTGPVSIN